MAFYTKTLGIRHRFCIKKTKQTDYSDRVVDVLSFNQIQIIKIHVNIVKCVNKYKTCVTNNVLSMCM